MSANFPHESAIKHVSGASVFVDDIIADERLLYGYVLFSRHAHARIRSVDISAAKAVQGVHAVLTAADIPGINQMGPVYKDEQCLAENKVLFIGQAVCLIAAETEGICRQAARLITIDYQPLPAILTIEQAMAKKQQMGDTTRISKGDPSAAFKKAVYIINGEFRTGAQEHWYLETQVCLCNPGESQEINVYSSTQHPSETQALIADVLGIPRSEVRVEVRRMGGAFGGKETQANHTACWTALLCQAVNRPVKIRLCRDDDQKMTGKRHPYLNKYKVGFDNRGLITAAEFELNSNAGASMDLSFAIMERALFHIDNAYFIPNLSVTGRMWQTNLPPNTALRGFGAPQAMATIENIIDRIARFLKTDPAQIRKWNFYGIKNKNLTHYGQKVEGNHLAMIYRQIVTSSDYFHRRQEINHFNASNEFMKKGLALSPVKFGIAFTTTHLNQAAALVHIHQDGTVLINHGGTEMGQGLHTKILQIAAAELGVRSDCIKINATDTAKVVNTSATAASSGTDLNGMAVREAIKILKHRLVPVIQKIFNNTSTADSQIVFADSIIYHKNYPRQKITFKEAIQAAYLQRISLSTTGYYRTPQLSWDKKTGQGRPFNYYAFGMAVSEVALDILSGHHVVLRADILHDAGCSINPGIDLGQVQGGFVQGLGWCTTEDCKWDEQGNLLNHSPDTYKIPTVTDIPRDFRVTFLTGKPNPYAVSQSKAVGEPPLMLALSVWLAIKDAISAVKNHTIEPELHIPATNEAILIAIDQLA
jgi:xanthine dehydrogenase molybdopterin binding subunit